MSSSRALVVLLLLSACGFQMRGEAPMGLTSLHVSTVAASQVADEVKRSLAAGPTRVVPAAAQADAELRILEERRDKSIFTLTGAGRVYEYQLQLTVRYQVTTPGREAPLIAPSEIDVRRVVTYSETAPVAKEAEEQLLFRDMNIDAAGQILRRIAVVRPAS
jgi:LPS-assembly lipoprotein